MNVCSVCGKPNWHWSHAVMHPATQGREGVHTFVRVGTPVATNYDDVYYDLTGFNNVVDDETLDWALGIPN